MKILEKIMNIFIETIIALVIMSIIIIILTFISSITGCVSYIPLIEPNDLCEPKQLTDLCPQLPLIIDLDQSNVDETLILDAVEEWEFCADLSLCYSTDLFEFGSGNLTINEVEEDGSSWVGYATWYYSNNIIVECNILLKFGLWTNNVLIHELGHCLSLLHDNEPNSVMRQHTGDNLYILSHHINHLLYCQENSESNITDYEIGEDYIYFE